MGEEEGISGRRRGRSSRGAAEEKGPCHPLLDRSFLEAVWVGQLGGGVCSAGLIWKPEGWGRALEKTMGLCV